MKPQRIMDWHTSGARSPARSTEAVGKTRGSSLWCSSCRGDASTSPNRGNVHFHAQTAFEDLAKACPPSTSMRAPAINVKSDTALMRAYWLKHETAFASGRTSVEAPTTRLDGEILRCAAGWRLAAGGWRLAAGG